jgi:hypothetical protein
MKVHYGIRYTNQEIEEYFRSCIPMGSMNKSPYNWWVHHLSELVQNVTTKRKEISWNQEYLGYIAAEIEKYIYELDQGRV